MSDLPTVAARVLMRADRVRDQVRDVPQPGGFPADMPEDVARENGPLLLAYLRLAIAEWRRPGVSATPQNLSQVLMSAEKAIVRANDEKEQA